MKDELLKMAQDMRELGVWQVNGDATIDFGDMNNFADRLESIANAAQGEPVAWRINHEPDMGGPVLIKAQPNEHAKARLAHLGVSVTPLYAAPPSDSAQVLVKALEEFANSASVPLWVQERAAEALTAHKSEGQK